MQNAKTAAANSRQARTKDKLKQHSRNETRRRARIRDQFDALRVAISCDKKDRYNILQASVEVVEGYQQRMAQLEQLVLKYESATKLRFKMQPLPASILANLPSTVAAAQAAIKRKRAEALEAKHRREDGEDFDDDGAGNNDEDGNFSDEEAALQAQEANEQVHMSMQLRGPSAPSTSSQSRYQQQQELEEDDELTPDEEEVPQKQTSRRTTPQSQQQQVQRVPQPRVNKQQLQQQESGVDLTQTGSSPSRYGSNTSSHSISVGATQSSQQYTDMPHLQPMSGTSSSAVSVLATLAHVASSSSSTTASVPSSSASSGPAFTTVRSSNSSVARPLAVGNNSSSLHGIGRKSLSPTSATEMSPPLAGNKRRRIEEVSAQQQQQQQQQAQQLFTPTAPMLMKHSQPQQLSPLSVSALSPHVQLQSMQSLAGAAPVGSPIGGASSGVMFSSPSTQQQQHQQQQMTHQQQMQQLHQQQLFQQQIQQQQQAQMQQQLQQQHHHRMLVAQQHPQMLQFGTAGVFQPATPATPYFAASYQLQPQQQQMQQPVAGQQQAQRQTSSGSATPPQQQQHMHMQQQQPQMNPNFFFSPTPVSAAS